MAGNEVKKLKEVDAENLFNQPDLNMSAKISIATMMYLTKHIIEIEKTVKSQIELKKTFQCLLSMPGIGDIPGLTIMLEVGDIKRFAKVGDYSSYCRCVSAKRLSNGKSKGKGNSKNGNRYLAWAYVEAANKAIRWCEDARKFYQRKMAKENNVVAIKALSNKISKGKGYLTFDCPPRLSVKGGTLLLKRISHFASWRENKKIE